MTIKKLDASTPDLTRQNIERLLELFPECRTEGSREDAPSVDFDLLRQALSDYLVEGPAERYRLDWPGKRQALLTANTPIDKTLRPMREESVDFDTTRNLFIEGDNLDALKLLQETYLGKVKMIYIDPPYNTGNDFIYRDNFAQSRKEYEEESKERSETAGRLVANTSASGRFHSSWLTMMYSRLKLARNLLSEDGAIFISIDDGEVGNLRNLADEIFGESNFISNIIWQKKYSPQNDAKYLSDMHDHVLLYAKDREVWRPIPLPRTEKQNEAYKNPDDDPRGPWKATDSTCNKSRSERPNLYYPMINGKGDEVLPLETRVWRYSRDVHEEKARDNRVWWGKDGTNAVPAYKSFLSEVKDGRVPTTIWDYKEAGHNQSAKQELNELLANSSFGTPKPTKLIRLAAAISVQPDEHAIILDFFGGSGSTAHAVIDQNASDGGNRRFIVVQLDEPIDEKSEAAQAGFEDIAEISRERIRRAGANALNESPELKGRIDVGFRSLRIDDGNLVDTSVTPKEATQEALLGMVSHIKDDRSEEDLLFGALLRWGVDITLPIEQRELAGRTVWLVDAPEDGSGKGAALIACFAKPGSSGKGGIDTELADALAELAPLRVLFRDDGFADDATKENVHSRFQQRAPDTQVRVL